MKQWMKLLMVFAVVLLVAGCGQDDDKRTVFMIDEHSDPVQAYKQIEDKMQDKLGTTLKVEVSASPMYNPQKLMVEYAAGGHSIVILPEEDMKNYAKLGGHLPLDKYFDPKKYPDGVFASNEVRDDKTVDTTEHLYGIPVKQMKLFIDAKYTPEQLYATIPVAAPSVDDAVKMLKALTE
ncbi:type 2 periplasmic-binding domain-containing protein [Paenibacillus pini]|uniref:Uncharacterized protein n=1 Tax=Paenibacillus pini JCM 16418 TaxID=1236976 RepID=W7YNI4_9BACL|nr:hypothetical protein [Paenibacillus pini]GAF06196.1 hypothetical protein JCM16418_144 [Paenibacillus pini JCM 16418]